MSEIPEKVFKALHWIVDILNKHQIQYQISGGLAAHLYGSERPINDIDLDISETDFEKIYQDVKEYITLEPLDFKNEKWDLKLMTLEYYGQEIDIGGAFQCKIFNETSEKWVSFSANFTTSRNMKVFDLDLKVVDPKDLIEYKKLLSGKHQETDIEAVQKFISNQNL